MNVPPHRADATATRPVNLAHGRIDYRFRSALEAAIVNSDHVLS
jgi:hypothetical protein